MKKGWAALYRQNILVAKSESAISVRNNAMILNTTVQQVLIWTSK